MQLTDKQLKLIEHYATKAKVGYDELITRIHTGRVTISEIVAGILGTK